MPHDRSQNSEEPRTDSRATHDRSAADGRAQTRLINRRDCLRVGTATVLSAAGLTTGASAATTRYGITFDRVVDATDYGADPSGDSVSTQAINDALDDGTLVVLPPGRYLVDGSLNQWNGTAGLYGDGDVELVPVQGYNDTVVNVSPDRFLFENIDIDIRATDTVTGFSLRVTKQFHVQDVTIRGRGTHPDNDVTNAFSVKVEDPNGTGILRNVTAKKGSAIGRYKAGDGRVGVYCGPNSEGTVKIENCHFEEFGNNGLYCSRTPGDVHVTNSYFRNNNVACVRISGDGSYVRDSTIEIDMSAYSGPTDSTEYAFNTRGVWFEQAQGRFDFPAGALVEGCEINVSDAWQSAGAIVAQDSAKTVDIRNTVIRVDTDGVRAINRTEPSRANSAVHLDDVSIVGSADGNESVLIRGADDSTVTNSCIYGPGDRRSAIRIVDADGCSVTDTNLCADDERLEERYCSVSTSGLTNRDSCPVSSPDELSNDLLIESVGSEDNTKYEITVSGELQKGDRANSGDEVSGSTANGAVAGGGSDTYKFDGEVTSATVTSGDPNDIAVSVNGNQIDLGGDLDRSIRIESVGEKDWTKYEITVSGDLQKGDYANSNDEVSGSTATGGVTNGGYDTYTFSGDVTSATVTSGDPDDIAVFVDGNRIDLGSDLDRSIRIESVGSKDGVRYEFTVSGDLEKGEHANGDSNDQVDGSTATGGVGGGGYDTYIFSGDVTDFTVTKGDHGDVAVFVDGEETSLGSGGDNSILIESVGSKDGVRYEFEVSGDLQKGKYANGDSDDQLDGSTATGGVGGGGQDSYTYGGDVTRFTVTKGDPDDLSVSVNGEQTSLEDSDSHKLKVASAGSKDGVRYEFTVSGYLKKGKYANSDSDDQVDGSTATGGVAGNGYDTYEFGGDLNDFTVTKGDPDDVAVYVDGSQVI